VSVDVGDDRDLHEISESARSAPRTWTGGRSRRRTVAALVRGQLGLLDEEDREAVTDRGSPPTLRADEPQLRLFQTDLRPAERAREDLEEALVEHADFVAEKREESAQTSTSSGVWEARGERGELTERPE